MLSIEPLKSARGAADYYTAAFNYYAGDASAMTWLGQGASYLQLNGNVDKDAMLALLKGELPNGQRLQNLKGEHRPGFDMTFSAPKSLSILVGLGIAPELSSFHDKAVAFAIKQIEQEFAQTRLSRQGEVVFEKTNNLLVAAFRQPSSRANDPALHTHCVAMNMTFHEQKWRSLASDSTRSQGVIEQIQNNAHYCGLIYRQHLANQLKEAQFSLRPSGDGLFEIEGVPDKVLKEFSRRREDIERHMEKEGWHGAKSAAAATLVTRNEKEEIDYEKMMGDWKARADELGFNAESFMQQRKAMQSKNWFSQLYDKIKSLMHHSKGDLTDESIAAKACVEVATEILSQRTSVFSERTLTKEAMAHSLGYLKPLSHQAIVEAIAAHKKQQSLYEGRSSESGEVLLTTPWLLTVEAESLARIEQNKGVMSPIATLSAVKTFQNEREDSRPFPLTNSQKEAMKILLTSKDRFLAIQGYAGVAKTSMLAEARLLVEAKGYSLRGITVASSAAHELQTKAGIKSDVFPIAHQELKNAATASLSKTVFIVDEASMLSSHQGHDLMKQIERTGARLVLVGDKAQLPSVNTSRIFSLSQDYGIETAVMNEIVRQKNAQLKEAVIDATQGKVSDALNKLNVQELETHEERIQWIANHWLSLSPKERDETLLFAPTHANRQDITMLLRDGLKKEGTLKGNEEQLTVLHAKQLEAVQLRFVNYFERGNIIRFNQSFKKGTIKAGEYYQVGAVKKELRQKNILPLINEHGKTIHFSLNLLPQYKTHQAPFERIIEVYQPKKLALMEGDKVMWTRNFNRENIRNGQRAVLNKIDEKTVTFITNEGETLVLDKVHPALRHLDHSYVLTNYKVQGKDAPYGIGLMESSKRFGTTIKNFYVQISRAVHQMTLVTDNKEALAEAIKRNKDEKAAAIDIIDQHKLTEHQQRFSQATGLLKHIIKQKNHRNFKQETTAVSSKRIDDLNYSKEGSEPQKTLQPIKELEL